MISIGQAKSSGSQTEDLVVGLKNDLKDLKNIFTTQMFIVVFRIFEMGYSIPEMIVEVKNKQCLCKWWRSNHHDR